MSCFIIIGRRIEFASRLRCRDSSGSSASSMRGGNSAISRWYCSTASLRAVARVGVVVFALYMQILQCPKHGWVSVCPFLGCMFHSAMLQKGWGWVIGGVTCGVVS